MRKEEDEEDEELLSVIVVVVVVVVVAILVVVVVLRLPRQRQLFVYSSGERNTRTESCGIGFLTASVLSRFQNRHPSPLARSRREKFPPSVSPCFFCIRASVRECARGIAFLRPRRGKPAVLSGIRADFCPNNWAECDSDSNLTIST